MHPDEIGLHIPERAEDLSDEILLQLMERMLVVRLYEEKIVELYPDQEMKTPVHLCIGQEAISAGVCQALEQKDKVFSNHRSHGHYLAKGGDFKRLAAELYGKKTGCSGGKGGSMHVVDMEMGVCGSTGIVGGGIPLATGAALASSIRGDGEVAVTFFGDGAADEGAFFESMGLAALKKLPVLFVLENNFYATCSPLSKRRNQPELYKLGLAHDIPSVRLDGNDAQAVYKAARKAVERARSGEGPTLIEAVTCRWKGHVGPECDVDRGYRSSCELEAWKDRCPVQLFENVLKSVPGSGEKVLAMKEAIAGRIDEAFAFAQESPYPSPEETYDHVW